MAEAKGLSWATVKHWKAAPVDRAAVAVRRVTELVLQQSDDLARIDTRGEWTGQAAELSRKQEAGLRDRLEHQVAQLGRTRAALTTAAEGLEGVESVVRQAEGLAHSCGLSISDDGVVRDSRPPDLSAGLSDQEVQAQKAQRTQLVRECADLVHAALTRADCVDRELEAQVRAARIDQGGDGGATTLQQARHLGETRGGHSADALRPPHMTRASEVSAWWKSLSHDEQKLIESQHPEWIGNRDGIPVAARSAANKRLLPGKRAQYRRELDFLLAHEPEGRPPDGPAWSNMFTQGSEEWEAWNEKRDAVENKLRGVEAIQSRLQGVGGADTYLIGFEPDRGNGQAVVSLGNPDEASRVSTFVTGAGTKLGGINGDVTRSDTMRKEAQRAGRNDRIASITWYGYEAPTLSHAYDCRYAQRGAPALRSFQESLRLTHGPGGPSKNTIVAHSFGTTLTGEAASHGSTLDADRLVFLGSPGVRVDHVSGLHLSGVSSSEMGDRVFASTAPSDPIRAVDEPSDRLRRATGVDLGSSPAYAKFGATVFPTADFNSYIGSHGGYWATKDNPGIQHLAEAIAK